MTDQEFQNGISVLLERVNTRQSGTLLGMLRSRLVCCSAAELTAEFAYPAQDWEANPFGNISGGVIATAIDCATGCLMYAVADGKKPVTVSLQVSYLRAAPLSGELHVRAHITKVGHFIRRTSIDELPQIYNIFLGQMSFVGPRPALWNQDALIAERDRYDANEVKPGLTGLAQISGRDELEIDVKAKLDGEYVKKRGLFYDLGLLFRTVFSVFRHEGVVEGGTGEIRKREENGTGDGDG